MGAVKGRALVADLPIWADAPARATPSGRCVLCGRPLHAGRVEDTATGPGWQLCESCRRVVRRAAGHVTLAHPVACLSWSWTPIPFGPLRAFPPGGSAPSRRLYAHLHGPWLNR